VVRTKPSTKVLYVVLLTCVVLEIGLAGAVTGLAVMIQEPMFLTFVPLLGLQVGLMLLVVREYQGLLGPQLAADHTGIWVRTGLGSRPETVFLPWADVDGVDATRKGPVLRIMSRAGDALYQGRRHWRARYTRRRFGTSFIVDGRRSAVHPADLAAHLSTFRR
jgi:hypothetical protein